MIRLELATPGLQTQCFSHTAQKLLLGRSWVYPVGVLHHYTFIISQLWLTSHPRSTVVLLDTGTPGTSREIYSEDADGETRTRNPWITLIRWHFVMNFNNGSRYGSWDLAGRVMGAGFGIGFWCFQWSGVSFSPCMLVVPPTMGEGLWYNLRKTLKCLWGAVFLVAYE